MWVREKVTNGPFLVGRCEGLRGKKGLLKNKPCLCQLLEGLGTDDNM